MIWIKNHGIRGESDNLRRPLSNEVEEITSHINDPKNSPAIARHRGWVGVDIDADVDDVRDGFEAALGTQVRFAVNEPSDHDDYNDKSDELSAFYDGSHPDADV